MRKLSLTLLIAVMLLLTMQSVSAQTTATGIVTAYHLNVRDYPDPNIGNIIARVGHNEVYQVTARSAINSWWQIMLSDGRLGWVNGYYLAVYNADYVPTINPSPSVPQPTTNAIGTVTAYYLNARNAPNAITGSIVQVVTRGQNYNVIGRNGNSSWWQIMLGNGVSAWVNGRFLSVSNAQLVPVTDNSVPPGTVTNASGMVTSYYLNVRSSPNAIWGSIISVISRGQSFEVIGRNATSTWWQIRISNTTGWVSGRYFSVSNAQSVPITG